MGRDSGGGGGVRTLEAAMLEIGDDAKRLILARGDMLTLASASALSGLSARVLSRQRRANRVLALPLPGSRPHYRYPAFQFEPAVCDALPKLLDLFGRGRAWQLFDFLMHPDLLLQAKIPLDLLRCGRGSDVLRVARVAAMLEQGAH